MRKKRKKGWAIVIFLNKGISVQQMNKKSHGNKILNFHSLQVISRFQLLIIKEKKNWQNFKNLVQTKGKKILHKHNKKKYYWNLFFL